MSRHKEKNEQKLRILAASDFHGLDVVSKELAKKAEKEKADVIIIAGDVLNFGEYAKNMIKPFVEKNKAVLFVPGNHDTPDAVEEFTAVYHVKNLHSSYAVIGDVGFFGCGGTTTLPGFPHYFTENQVYYALKKGFEKIKDKKTKIMVTHVQAAGTKVDMFSIVSGTGSKAVKKAIERFKPDIHICGHIHELEGFEETLGKTRIFSVGKRGTVIDV